MSKEIDEWVERSYSNYSGSGHGSGRGTATNYGSGRGVDVGGCDGDGNGCGYNRHTPCACEHITFDCSHADASGFDWRERWS